MPDTTNLSTLLRSVRQRLRMTEQAGGDWRDVVDALRPVAGDVWVRLSPSDQDRFVRHLARHWEIARHRMSPDLAVIIALLQSSGRLTVQRLVDVDLSRFDVVVNGTRPAPVCAYGWSRVVDRLLDDGLARPHRLGLGFDVNEQCALVDAGGIPARPCW